MKERVPQLFIIALLLLTLQAFDYSLNRQLPSTIPVTGAAVSEFQAAPCAETSPCKSPTSWKCQSSSICYDYSDCLFQCPATPSPEEKDEQQPEQACTCSDWQTTGNCGEQGCPLSKVPQSKSCTGGSACKTENRCVESTQCKKDQLPSLKCVDNFCTVKDYAQYCSSKCTIDGKRYKTSECEQKCAEAEAAKAVEDAAEAVEALEGVNLVPELVVTTSEDIKGGDTIKVTLYIKNTGTKNAYYSDIKGGGTSINNVINFYKDQEYGSRPFPLKQAPLSLLSAIKPGDAPVKVVEQSVKLPEDFSRDLPEDLVIVAVVDTNSAYPEQNEDDNKLAITIPVRAAKMPDLVATEAEAVPTLEKVPVTLSSVKIKVKNIGELDAVAAQQFLTNKVSVRKGSTEICSGYTVNLITIKPGAFAQDLPAVGVKTPNGNPCLIDEQNANYWAIVEVDAVEPEKPRGAVLESNEENTFPIQLKGPQQCSPIGAREAGKYCSIATGTWLTQKAADDLCSHNFECKTDVCLGKDSSSKKCISEEKKMKILEIAG